MIQIRTPALKKSMCNSNTALTEAQAYKNTSVARVGHHNDCFLASADDYGTYEDISNEYPYLEQETKYTPMGGETCAVNKPRSQCPTALAEIQKFHWSYLNSGYHDKVISGFKTEGCYYTIQNRLGYRFELVSGTYPQSARVNSAFSIQIRVNNSGYATPFNKRIAYLVLRNTLTNQEYSFAMNSDARLWASGKETLINEIVQLPSTIQVGSYKLFLNLPDMSASISKKADYSIRFSNDGLWESTTGYNSLLHIINIAA